MYVYISWIKQYPIKLPVTRMHSSRMCTDCSSSCRGGSASVQAGIHPLPPGVGLETPQLWCGDPQVWAWRSPGVGLETPQVWAWRNPPGCGSGETPPGQTQLPPPRCGPGDLPWPNFPPGCGPGNLQGMLGYQPPWRPAARHAGIPPAMHTGIPPPPLWTESQTRVKTEPCPNFVAGGNNSYNLQCSCGKVMFLHVSVSFCSRGVWQTPRPWQADTPTPPGRHPRAGRHPPRDGHCSRRYISYWNAFLLIMVFTKLTAQEKYIWKHSKYGIQAKDLAMAETKKTPNITSKERWSTCDTSIESIRLTA